MFEKNVNLNNRQEMIEFLKNHFKYPTANSWNFSTSYANCVKLHALNIPQNLHDKFFSALEVDDYYDTIVSPLIDAFGEKHKWKWQVNFNGRSNGYLVLYQGFTQQSEYKSYCVECGQKNYQPVSEKSHTCGVCGGDRVNYSKPPVSIGVFPMRGTDMDENFEDWDISKIRERVELVKEFDALCDEIREKTIEYLRNNDFSEEVVYIPTKVKVAKRSCGNEC